MEFKEVVGRRRSVRYYNPEKPVEREKIQAILEAARLAPGASNLSVLRAIVVEREKASKELIGSIAEFNRAHVEQAPILIAWYIDMIAWKDRPEKMKELIDVGALKPTHGWSYEYIDKVYLNITRRDPLMISYVEGGQGIAYANLAAVDEGLGVCINTCDPEAAKKALGLPDTAIVLWIMTVGYPAESEELEGQRPRRPFEELFSLNKYKNPFPSDEKVVEKLKKERMIRL